MAFIEFKTLTVADTAIATISYNKDTDKVELTTKDAKTFILTETLEEARSMLTRPAWKEVKTETRLWLDTGSGVSALNDFLETLARAGSQVVSVTSDASNPDKVWWTVLYRTER